MYLTHDMKVVASMEIQLVGESWKIMFMNGIPSKQAKGGHDCHEWSIDYKRHAYQIQQKPAVPTDEVSGKL